MQDTSHQKQTNKTSKGTNFLINSHGLLVFKRLRSETLLEDDFETRSASNNLE